MSEFSILLALAVVTAAGFIVTRFDPSRGHARPTNRLLIAAAVLLVGTAVIVGSLTHEPLVGASGIPNGAGTSNRPPQQ
jgi:hypothetical protein